MNRRRARRPHLGVAWIPQWYRLSIHCADPIRSCLKMVTASPGDRYPAHLVGTSMPACGMTRSRSHPRLETSPPLLPVAEGPRARSRRQAATHRRNRGDDELGCLRAVAGIDASQSPGGIYGLQECHWFTLLAQFARYFPALAPMVVARELSTPLTTLSFIGSQQGAIYGLSP